MPSLDSTPRRIAKALERVSVPRLFESKALALSHSVLPFAAVPDAEATFAFSARFACSFVGAGSLLDAGAIGGATAAMASFGGVFSMVICARRLSSSALNTARSEEHTSELQSQSNLVCRLLLEKKKNRI